MPKYRPSYPAKFRQLTIELAQAGRSSAELSRQFELSAQTIINWLAHTALVLPRMEGARVLHCSPGKQARGCEAW